MSIYFPSPENETDGFVIGYAVYHNLFTKFMKSNDYVLNDILLSRSKEELIALYNYCEPHKLHSLTQSEWNALPPNKRPTKNKF